MTQSLDGQLLIAMPSMGDPRFARTVILMCAHSEDGAMGLIVNKPSPDLDVDALLAQLGVASGAVPRLPIHLGGPVEHSRGFVLHSPDYAVEGATLDVRGQFGMTATLDVLRDIAAGDGPEDRLLALGYSGWGPGQLEAELQANGWLVCEASRELVFDLPDAAKWEAAIACLGIDLAMLSAEGGSA